MHPVLNQWQTFILEGDFWGKRRDLLLEPRKVAHVDGVWRVALHEYGHVILIHSHRQTRVELSRIGDVRLGASTDGEYFEVGCGIHETNKTNKTNATPDGLTFAPVQPRQAGPDVGIDDIQHPRSNGLMMVRSLLASMEANHG